MHKGYKYCLLPTKEQAEWLEGLFRACRYIYNVALETKIAAWTSARINLSEFDLNNQLAEAKKEFDWLYAYPCQCLQAENRKMMSAYKSFFRGRGFPKFKKRSGRQSASFPKGISVVGNKIKVPKIGLLQFVKHRELPSGTIKTVVISKEPSGKFFVSLLILQNWDIPAKLEITEPGTIGVDVGLKSFATLSNGQRVDNPKYLSENLQRLRVEQKKLARRFKKGQKEQSKSYQKQRIVVAKLHGKILNKRKDFLHKLSHDLIKNNNAVCIEDLNVRGMMQNEKLSKAIGDVAWSEFARMLEYKAEWTGKNIIKIGRFAPSTKLCSNCGYKNNELSLADREWDCPKCGVLHDRDINAAINIKNFGLQAEASTVKTDQQIESMG